MSNPIRDFYPSLSPISDHENLPQEERDLELGEALAPDLPESETESHRCLPIRDCILYGSLASGMLFFGGYGVLIGGLTHNLNSLQISGSVVMGLSLISTITLGCLQLRARNISSSNSSATKIKMTKEEIKPLVKEMLKPISFQECVSDYSSNKTKLIIQEMVKKY